MTDQLVPPSARQSLALGAPVPPPPKAAPAEPVYEIDPDDFTTDEIAEFEELAGMNFKELNKAFGTGELPLGKAIKVLTWFAMRKVDPSATLADAGRAKVRQLKLPNAVTEAAKDPLSESGAAAE